MVRTVIRCALRAKSRPLVIIGNAVVPARLALQCESKKGHLHHSMQVAFMEAAGHLALTLLRLKNSAYSSLPFNDLRQDSTPSIGPSLLLLYDPITAGYTTHLWRCPCASIESCIANGTRATNGSPDSRQKASRAVPFAMPESIIPHIQNSRHPPSLFLVLVYMCRSTWSKQSSRPVTWPKKRSDYGLSLTTG